MAPHGQPAGAGRADLARARRCSFGIVLQALSFALLSPTVEHAERARSRCAGFLGYVLVYTVWLKRRTPQNIVIGGAAGAVPPLVGWAAVTGRVDPAALYLFAIVFYWTPPHFWALSLLMKDEYARVGVPMMPVVHGEAETRRQILLYTLPAGRADAAAGRLRLLRRDLRRRRGRRSARAFIVARACACSAAPTARSALRTYLFSLAYLAAAVRRDGARRPAVDSPPRMDRKLARRNLRTGLIVADDHGLLMFGLTFLAACDLHRLMSTELETRARPPAGEEIHMPAPSILPLVNAAALALAIVGAHALWYRDRRHRRWSSSSTTLGRAGSRARAGTTSPSSRSTTSSH